MYVVTKVQAFEIAIVNDMSIRATLVPQKKVIGYLPVYRTREDALAEFPGAENSIVGIAEIKED